MAMAELDIPISDAELRGFWAQLPLADRRKLLSVKRPLLFEEIRRRYCSRCFGLYVLRYEELCGAACEVSGGSACEACPRCQQLFLGLVADAKAVRLDEGMVTGDPFGSFDHAELRERERELQFLAAGDVCGSGFNPRKHGKVCQLHTSLISGESLLSYWHQLPKEHRQMLLSLPRHDFEAELDSCCTLQLRVCRDCRYNVMQQYKVALAAGRRSSRAAAATATGGGPLPQSDDAPCDACGSAGCGSEPAYGKGDDTTAMLPSCGLLSPMPGCLLIITEDMVTLICPQAAVLFERAEEMEETKMVEMEEDQMDVRHAETPALAHQVLMDAAVLIFKAQVEVAFKEQTAGHNALLLLTHLALRMMKCQLQVAALDVRARQAQAELLQQLEDTDRRKLAAKQRKKEKKKQAKGKAAAGQDLGHRTPSEEGSSVAALSRCCCSASDSQSEDGGPLACNGEVLNPDGLETQLSPMLDAPLAAGSRCNTGPAVAAPAAVPAASTTVALPLVALLAGVSLERQKAWESAVLGEEWEVQQRSRKPAARKAAAAPHAAGKTLPLPRRPLTSLSPATGVVARQREPVGRIITVVAAAAAAFNIPQTSPEQPRITGKWAAVVAGASPSNPQRAAQRVVAIIPPPASRAVVHLPETAAVSPCSTVEVLPPQTPLLGSAWRRPEANAAPMPLKQTAVYEQLFKDGASVYSLWGGGSGGGASLPHCSSRDSLATFSDSVSLYGSPPLVGPLGPQNGDSGLAGKGGHQAAMQHPVSPLLSAQQGGMWSAFAGGPPIPASAFDGKSLQLPGSDVWGSYCGSAQAGSAPGLGGDGGYLAALARNDSKGDGSATWQAQHCCLWDRAQPNSATGQAGAPPAMYQLFGTQQSQASVSNVAW